MRRQASSSCHYQLTTCSSIYGFTLIKNCKDVPQISRIVAHECEWLKVDISGICTATDATNFTKLAHLFTQYKRLNTEPIKHGTKYESIASNEYMAKKQVMVNTSSIVVRRWGPHLACSSDGLVGDDGLVEVKCLNTGRDHTHSVDIAKYPCNFRSAVNHCATSVNEAFQPYFHN